MTKTKIVSIIMAALIMVMMPLQALAADGGKYVSDVYTAYGKDEDAARAALTGAGFTPVEGNLNEGGKSFVMFGYKTTNDPKLAIRDLALMNSKGGYSVGDYEELINKKKQDIAVFLKEFMDLIKEYRANYRDGNGKAVIAHDLLNNYVEDDSKKKMGDLLLEDTLQDKVGVDAAVTADPQEGVPDLTTIIMQGNAVSLRTCYSVLAMAADSKGNTFIDRFAKTTHDDLMEAMEKEKPNLTESKLAQAVAGKYDNIATTLSVMMGDLRKEFKEYEESELKIEEATPKDLDKEFGNTDDPKDPEMVPAVNEKTDWAATAMLYEQLKNYEGGNFKKGELLKFFMEESDDNARLYPMAAALTKGQTAAISMIPMDTLLRYSFLDEDTWNQEAKELSKENKSIEDLSIYEGVDRDVFLTDGTVALTDAAKREQAAAMPVDEEGNAFAKVFTTSVLISYGATAASLAGTIAMSKYMVNVDKQFADLFLEFYESCKNDSWLKMSTYDDSIEKVLPAYNNAEEMYDSLTKTAMDHFHPERDRYLAEGRSYDIKKSMYSGLKYLTIALALISAGLTIYNIVKDEEIVLPPIPKYMVNADDNKTMNYKAQGGNGTSFKSKDWVSDYADTKAFEGKQWLTIYATTDEDAGDPITPDFLVQTEKGSSKDHDSALHIIGEKGAANLVNVDYMNYSKAQKIKNKDKVAYLFFSHGEPAETASAFSGGMIAIIAFVGIMIGALLAVIVMRSKKSGTAA